MDTKNPARPGSRRVLQLPVHTRDIPGMGCRSHRILQGILPLHLRDSLPGSNGSDTGCHTEFSDILTTRTMKRTIYHRYRKAGKRSVQRAALERRPFLFAGDMQMNRFKERKHKEQSDYTRPDELPGKGSGCFLPAGKVGPCGFREKSSSPEGCGIFPENLACRNHPLLPPYSSTGHVKPEYSPLK